MGELPLLPSELVLQIVSLSMPFYLSLKFYLFTRKEETFSVAFKSFTAVSYCTTGRAGSLLQWFNVKSVDKKTLKSS